jgi:Pyridine nucleotide-disulphide oxidoreductase
VALQAFGPIVPFLMATGTSADACRRECEVIEMHYFAGMTAEEVAVALTRSVHAVRRNSRVARSLVKGWSDCCVLVIGDGNSAGQGALHLARYAEQVQIVVRREDLRSTMSQYLIDQIAKTPNIRLRTCTEIDRADGDGHLEHVT